MILKDSEFNEIKDLLYDRFGIALADHKKNLVIGRLRKLVSQRGFSSYAEFIESVKKDKSGSSLSELIDKMSTNHTFFFREAEHFKVFKETALPEIVADLEQKRSKDLRIWCAAASTGEEPYSILMTMMEYFKTSYVSWDAGLLATDISSRVLANAEAGIYPSDSVMNIPAEMRRKYLKQIDSESWEFLAKVRREITFRRFNLMNTSFPFKKQFHVIFCRNVMIYFDKPTRHSLVQRMYDATAPGGYLFIGHSESIRAHDCPYEYVQPAVFRKRKV